MSVSMVYRSTKLFDGYSTCFRQWRATNSHCQYLHGYSLEFKVIFEGTLDTRNWVMDFGAFKHNGVKKYLSSMFDHTLIVAEDDPCLDMFKEFHKFNLVQLRILKDVGCEKFAELVYKYLTDILKRDPRVWVHSVECIENKKNSAYYAEK